VQKKSRKKVKITTYILLPKIDNNDKNSILKIKKNQRESRSKAKSANSDNYNRKQSECSRRTAVCCDADRSCCRRTLAATLVANTNREKHRRRRPSPPSAEHRSTFDKKCVHTCNFSIAIRKNCENTARLTNVCVG